VKKHSQQPSPIQDYQLPEVDWVLADMAFAALRGILGDDERARRKIEKLTHNKRLRWARLRHNAGWFAKPEPLSPELSCQIALKVGYPFVGSDDGLVPDYSQPELIVFIDDKDQSTEFEFFLLRAALLLAFPSLGSTKRKTVSKQVERALKGLRWAYPPDGDPPDGTTDAEAYQAVKVEFKNRKLKRPPSLDSVKRARGTRTD